MRNIQIVAMSEEKNVREKENERFGKVVEWTQN